MKRKQPLTRQAYLRRFVCNTVLCLALAAVLWMINGCPLPQTMALRRLERQQMLEPSTIILETDDNRNYGYTLLLGVTEKHIQAFDLRKGDGRLTLWERKGTGPTVVVLPQPVRYWGGEGYASAPMLAAVDSPPDAVSARLTMTLTFDGVINDQSIRWERTYTMDGTASGGCFLFQMIYQEGGEGSSPAAIAEESWLKYSTYDLIHALQQNSISYTLEYFDIAGQMILTQSNL